MTDEELVARASGGDRAAFGELVVRHQAAVYRAARTVLADRAEAQDAAQDAFVTAFSELRRFRRQSSFRTWLLTIAWRTAINRRRRVVWWLRRRIEDRADPPATTASPEADAARREMSGALAAEIRSLSPRLRDALLLAGAGDCTYGEIAAMLNVPVGTVKWRVSPAERAQSANVRVEVTVSEQRGTATPARKTVSLVVADHERGYVRSMAMMPATSQKDNPAVTNLSFDVDASAQFLDGTRVRLNITMKIETPDRGDSDALVTPAPASSTR